MDRPSHRTSGSLWRLLAGLLLFAAGFAIANRFQLTHAVLYRAAANDLASAVTSFAMLALQGAALLAAIVLLSRGLFALAMLLAGSSILVNLGYGQTVKDVIDAGKLDWLFAEARQAGNAAGEFTGPLLLAATQAVLAIVLFIGARALLRRGLPVPASRTAPAIGLALLLAPTLLALPLQLSPPAAERNLYSLGLEIALAEPPPPRAAVTIAPGPADSPRHIVWLVDESVAHAPFHRLIAPALARWQPLDFGVAASLGNCSAPANVALRSGVDVRRAGPQVDLRKTPSIWGYARKAGYRTVLVDGQTKGSPQNLILPPERALIDEVRLASDGLDTDREIAGWLNGQLKRPQRTFTYVVLRGVHFQYRDHYPAGLIPDDSPVARQYDTALAYSKDRFFDRLLAGVNREDIAVVYTSDHGQNFAAGALPHCSREPVADEFRIPLLAFLPERFAVRYAGAGQAGHSASQIFPATLTWMGYDPAAVQHRYDNDLSSATARYVWFDRNVIPLHTGDPVGVTAGATFPRLPVNPAATAAR